MPNWSYDEPAKKSYKAVQRLQTAQVANRPFCSTLQTHLKIQSSIDTG